MQFPFPQQEIDLNEAAGSELWESGEQVLLRHSEGQGWGGVRKLSRLTVLGTEGGSPSVTRHSRLFKSRNPASCEM